VFIKCTIKTVSNICTAGENTLVIVGYVAVRVEYLECESCELCETFLELLSDLVYAASFLLSLWNSCLESLTWRTVKVFVARQPERR
jgi:hypothetical protein